ncbi:MAG: EAL domain-containing response regulator [Porticoccaceae bacterium]
MTTIYILDDDAQQVDLLLEFVNAINLSASGFTEAHLFIKHEIFNHDIVILDLNMPGMDGIEVMRKLHSQDSLPTYILISGFDDRVLHSAKQFADAKKITVDGTFTKPVDIQQFIFHVNKLHQKLNLRPNENAEDLDEISPTVADNKGPSLYELKVALKEHQLTLHYQPQLDMKTGGLNGFEALVRWQHPEQGLLLPEKFIALAESNNIISELTSEVVQLAARDYFEFLKSGIHQRISINLSNLELLDLFLPEKLFSHFTEKDISPDAIVIELTETVLSASVSNSLDVLNRLRMKGFSLSIDDFGTGYSSLVQLYQAPFTELKIDQNFVAYMTKDDEAASIVKICILLAKELKMKSIAEGVETQEAWTALQNLGCDVAQGYLISKPMPVKACCDWVKAKQLTINNLSSNI